MRFEIPATLFPFSDFPLLPSTFRICFTTSQFHVIIIKKMGSVPNLPSWQSFCDLISEKRCAASVTRCIFFVNETQRSRQISTRNLSTPPFAEMFFCGIYSVRPCQRQKSTGFYKKPVDLILCSSKERSDVPRILNTQWIC